MNHRLRVLFNVLLAVLLALLATGEQSSLAESTTIYVDADATGANNGTSWVDAFTDLQTALDAAVSGDQIWVAEGTYKPTVAHGGDGDRYKSFQMKNGVAIFGGFTGAESRLEERNWANHVTILSGDIGTEGDASDNSFHVFYHPVDIALESSAILDGFTVSGGNANDYDGTGTIGGGMLNDSSSPTLTNCTFSGNSAGTGGGMYNSNSSPILTNFIFAGNSAVYNGGGMFNSSSSPVLTNCTFFANSARYEGGGMYNHISSPTLTNCILWGSQISGYNSTPVITYSDVQGGYTGMGNIAADPLFVDAANGDYHLTADSPCIDTGNDTAQFLPPSDFDGDARIQDGNGDGISIVDMGVDEAYYEAPPITILFVDQDATGAANGTSWIDAFTSLQPALDAAASGTQIWVAEGIYIPTREIIPGDPRSASFQMKNRVAIYGGFAGSESSLEQRDWLSNVTILSGDLNADDGPDFANNSENSYHVLYSAVLNSSAILNGFTITGGNANGDYPHGYGGGMYNTTNSTPTLTNCTISGNRASRGGGMYNYYSHPTLTNCTLAANRADYGGGIFNQNSSPVLTECTFDDNSVGNGIGGGMYNDSASSPTLINCTFTSNSADAGGGIFNNSSSSPVLRNCLFSGNSATSFGGGIYSTMSSPVLSNCIFSANTAFSGGGIYSISSTLTVINCTFSGNLADQGGAIYDPYSSSTVVINSILWDDTPNEILASSAIVTYSDIQGGYTGTGNINLDPLFVDALNGDFHLTPESPVIDAGNNAAPYLPQYDFDGDNRVLDANGDGTATVDMGMDEVVFEAPPPLIFYVDQDATGANNGSSWVDAFTMLQPALEVARSGDQIWVAEGTYIPTREFSPGDPRSVSFQMKNNVAIYGGFAGNESSLEERNWISNVTILSGDLNGDDESWFSNMTENSYHILYHPLGMNLDSTATLDGFTIRGGNANGGYPHNSGGGMINYVHSSPSLTNCIFTGNSADSDGGGIYNYSYSSPIMTNCIVEGNRANQSGGGMYNDDNSSPEIISCLISNNTASVGGGMANDSSTVVLNNCTFSDNHASYGGGMHNSSSEPTLSNCIFTNNTASYGGGMINSGSSPSLTNCTFEGNSASYNGGGMINNSSWPTLTDCSFTGNSAEESGGGMYNSYNSNPVLTGCSFTGNQAMYIGGGIYNNNSSPVLNNCSFTGNLADYSGGGMYNSAASPSLTNSTFFGNSAGLGGGVTNNDTSSPTMKNCTFSGNSAGHGGAMYNSASSAPSLINSTFMGNSADSGGAMVNDGSKPVITNCTFSGNSATNTGGSMVNTAYPGPVVSNSILWGNTPNEIYNSYNTSPEITFSDVQGGYVGEGNINVDPLFVDPTNSDFHLSPSSPVIDAGSNSVQNLPLIDFEGDARILDGNGDAIAIVDMGVDEAEFIPHTPEVIFVDQDATGANNGTSWADAFSTLQPALAYALPGDQIWVAAGIYQPTVMYGGTDARYKSFRMKNGVAIYGGFAGLESSLEERDWATNVTILSGDIGTEGNTNDNSYHVFYHPSEVALDSSAILDGFTITGAYADGPSPHQYGGGMLNINSSPTLNNISFSDNWAYDGGGMYNWNGASPTLNHCTFADNSTVWAGGGLYNNNSSPELNSCSFLRNTAGISGGGMANVFYAAPYVSNTIFWGNIAEYGGGVHNIDNTMPVITNCTFFENAAEYAGGGIYSYIYSSPVLTNDILWTNTPDQISGEPVTVTYSDVEWGYEGEGNIDYYPRFVDPANGDFHLGIGSRCIDAGNNAAINLPLYDFEGDARILDGDADGIGIVDMGVDETISGGGVIIEVTIDIKPSTLQNNIRLSSHGTVPVAILTTSGVDATNINPEKVLFAGAVTVRSILDDIDKDGDVDLVLYFKIQELELDEYSTYATLTGEFYDGLFIQGTDTVNIIP